MTFTAGPTGTPFAQLGEIQTGGDRPFTSPFAQSTTYTVVEVFAQVDPQDPGVHGNEYVTLSPAPALCCCVPTSTGLPAGTVQVFYLEMLRRLT